MTEQERVREVAASARQRLLNLARETGTEYALSPSIRRALKRNAASADEAGHKARVWMNALS